jgi:hypothetical protein
VTRGYRAIVILGLVVFAACDRLTQPIGQGGTTGPTITITSVVSSQDAVSISGDQVTFNNDSRSHEMASDPHPPTKTAPINQVGVLGAGRVARQGT